MARCSDCGFLGLLDTNGRMRDANQTVRSNGKFPSDSSNVLVCTKGVRDVQSFIKGDGNGIIIPLREDHGCVESIPWINGLTPQEHFMIEREKRQEETNDLREEKQRKWQSSESRKNTITAAIVGGIIGLVGTGMNIANQRLQPIPIIKSPDVMIQNILPPEMVKPQLPKT